MNASLNDAPQFASIHCEVKPLYFASGRHTLFGWLHRPDRAAMAKIGLVICNPFGYEMICAHRGVRAFAEAAAAIGIPALRFDYGGTGDSEDIEPQADQLEAWSGDIIAAVNELQRLTGVERVCLLGVRLGALLAMLAATQCEAASALIAVAPVVRGARLLRELRTFQATAPLAREASASLGATPANAPAPGAGSLEVTGFSLSAASVARLSELDLMSLRAPSLTDVLVIDRSDLPAARAWAESLSGLGMSARYLSLPGYSEMTTTPHATVIPQSMIAAMREWMSPLKRALSPQPVGSREQRVDRRSERTCETMSLLGNAWAPQNTLTERAVFVSSVPMLFGIVTEPRSGEARRRGVILLNCGATHHVGPNCMHVSFARRWAQHGYVVLRMDLAGLGDSATRRGRPENEVYPAAAIDDIRAAIEYLRSHYAVNDITLGGVCAGAYHSLRATVAGLAVNRVLMVNPLTFFWEAGMTLNDLQLAEVVNNPTVYRERVLAAKYWIKLLSGRVNVWRIVRIFAHRAWLALASSVRDLARRLHIRLPKDLGWELEEIAARGVRVVFVFARGDAGLDLLKIQGGTSVKRLGERCRKHVIDGADHIFSQSGPRALLENILSDELFVRRDDFQPRPASAALKPNPSSRIRGVGGRQVLD